MTIQPAVSEREPIPVTCFTGFLAITHRRFKLISQGKTTTILSVLQQLPKDYKVVLLKNEYGDVEVDSLLAKQSNITGVSEILNGCLCCTMVGLVENAMIEVRDTYHPDRIIIESSGSAFPATLALQIRQLEPEGFKLDGVVTVIDCVNFKGYEDTSPSAKLQAKYTDLLLLNKHAEVSERDYDILMDALGELNDETPRIRISPDSPPKPEVLFGLDTKLFEAQNDESSYWDKIGKDANWHGDEVETKTVWSGGVPPGQGAKRKRADADEPTHEHAHEHGECECRDAGEVEVGEVDPIAKGDLDAALAKLNFEIYRVKGLVRIQDDSPRGWTTHILNWAFGRSDLTSASSLDDEEELKGVRLRLTIMGERGEVAARARKFAESISANVK